MDKKQQLSDKKKSAVLRIQRTEAYAERVRLLFAKTVNDILALNKSMPKLEEGVMYSFDGTNDKMQKEVEMLLRRLASTVTTAIRNGINLEWEEANVECDKFIASIFGKKVLSSPEFSAWFDRNTSARDAFANRADKGLGLSDRVWKSVKQLREEMEVAMTVAIGEGDSASSMSRKVREYLNDPELMFRRFRYKAGEKEVVDKDTGEITKVPVYGRKWKKRVKDEATGKYRWVDYDRDSYKTGAGVYKSSAKNAMRVARTETNMAYRQADRERWQNMEFVMGQHIELSRNHPKRDICDDLEGDYPKDFVFDGWHPQCFCVCTPILVDWEEQRKVFRAKLKGETYTPKGKKITECPDNFKSWVNDNKEKIHVVRKSGKEPYFIKNNAAKIDGIINPQSKALTPIEIAKKRHDARTPEQVDAIRRRMRYRAKSIRAAEAYIKGFKDYPDNHYSALKSAYKRADWEVVRKEALVLARRKRTILEESIKSINIAKTLSSIDLSGLQRAIGAGNIKHIQVEREKLNDLIKKLTDKTTVLDGVLSTLDKTEIDYREVRPLNSVLKEEEIVNRVGGGDLTKGSCSSLAFTYAGNKAGLDVLDFRDGYSREFFAKTANIKSITESVGGIINKAYSDFDNARFLLSKAVMGKEYYFTCGRHAAIVRKTNVGFEYLELQSAISNGFKPLTDKVLKERFRAQRSHTVYGMKIDVTDVLIDIGVLKGDHGFVRMLGYINTAQDKQRKGIRGSVK